MQISIRLLQENELGLADRIFRLAFGTQGGHPNPENYKRDLYYMNRWYTNPLSAFAAEVDGQVVGANIAIQWGSFGLFGPLMVHPNFWNQGIAKILIEAATDIFYDWGIKQAGFFTSSNSPKHLNLYQKFGFYPRFLVALMSKSILLSNKAFRGQKYSELKDYEQLESLKACRELTDIIYGGLDVTGEIDTVYSRNLGDTVLVWDNGSLLGFAICHCGENTEAGKDICYIKFGAVRPGTNTEQWFEMLLEECEKFAGSRGLSLLVCGMNTERFQAYQKMIALGFQIDKLGVAMHKPNNCAYNFPDTFVIDDWR